MVNYSSLSYIVLALSSAVTYLSNTTSIFHDFPGPTVKFHDFLGLENEMLKVTRPSFFLGGGTILLGSSLVSPPLLLS